MKPVPNTPARITRRQALRTGAAAAVFSIVPRRVLGGPGYTPPSEELTKAVIGVGGMGQGHLKYAGARLLAVCDVDAKHLENALKKSGSDVKGYRDFREVLARTDIDIVHIPTPPHWHGPIAYAAACAGKDIWCEKPFTRTIGEGEKVVEAVRRYGRVLRINTWFRFRDTFYGSGTTARTLKKIVENGVLGWPLKINLSAATGFNLKLSTWSGNPHLPPQTPPDELDYELWLGPAPYRPYHPHRVHESFRGYWDYDGGGLGDMGQHYLDPFQYILDKDDESPVEIIPDTPPQHEDAVLPWRSLLYRYADGCEIRIEPAAKGRPPLIGGPLGNIYKGMESDLPNLRAIAKGLPETAPQITDFAESVRTRRKFALNEVNGHRSCTIVNLGKIALRLGRPLRFNSESQRFVDDDQANRYIHQPMREPWAF